jgi:Phage integrase, N-terminal SAM-like domain
VRHYSRRTERAYVGWIRRYVLFHGKRHPAEMGAQEVSRFLSWLAVEGRVTASTQNQALAALLFLYGPVVPDSVFVITAYELGPKAKRALRRRRRRKP